MRSDPVEALDTLRTSVYFRSLSPAEKSIKYPCRPEDEIDHLLTFDESSLEVFRERLLWRFRYVRETPKAEDAVLSINVVGVAPDCPMERRASWGCGRTLFLRDEDDLEHEYCHHLQREHPEAFIRLYRSWGFVPIPSQTVTDMIRRFGGIHNPDTRPFSIGKLTDMDYAYDPSSHARMPWGDLLVCFYDANLETVCVRLGHEPYRLEAVPSIRVFTTPTALNHPHELLADWISSNPRNFFVLFQMASMTSTIPPDLRLCVCADPMTQETSAHISLDTDAPPIGGCLCATTHEYPHAELCTSLASSPTDQQDRNPPHALARLVLFLFAGILTLSILIWILLNTVRYARSAKQ